MNTRKGTMAPVLYILLRTDLPSMNCGKACAQASHASNAFVKMAKDDLAEKRRKLFELWQNETDQGFGTVIVLAATRSELASAVDNARFKMFVAGEVVDPTYPYKVENGEIAKLIPTTTDTFPRAEIADPKAPVMLCRKEVTCGFIFGDKDELAAYNIVSHLKLHP